MPLRPLAPSAGGLNPGVGYLIILTNDLEDVNGNAATPDTDYLAIKNAQPSCAAITNPSLNGLCLLTGAHLAIAGAVGVPAADVVLTFSFTTQATGDTMNFAALLAQPTPIGVVDTTFDLSTLGIPVLPANDASIYAGTLEIPYYLDSAAPLSGSWQGAPFTAVPGAATTTHLTRFNPVPVPRESRNIPLFVTVPNATAKPAAGWPVVIFQHGLTGQSRAGGRDRRRLCGPGLRRRVDRHPAARHHERPQPFEYLPALVPGRLAERTFNLDLINNATGASGADGIDDPSGAYIINLSSLLTSRDNLRQGAIDFVQLATSLPGLDLDGDTVPDIDGTRIHFSGLSLGGIVGTVANAHADDAHGIRLPERPGRRRREPAPRIRGAFAARINAGLAAANALLVPGHDALRAVLPQCAVDRRCRRSDQLHRCDCRRAAGRAYAGDR